MDKVKISIRAKLFWKKFEILDFFLNLKKQEIYEMSARTPPGRFSIDFLLSKGNVPNSTGLSQFQSEPVDLIMGK